MRHMAPARVGEKTSTNHSCEEETQASVGKAYPTQRGRRNQSEKASWGGEPGLSEKRELSKERGGQSQVEGSTWCFHRTCCVAGKVAGEPQRGREGDSVTSASKIMAECRWLSGQDRGRRQAESWLQNAPHLHV
jgi:hypothetical protein